MGMTHDDDLGAMLEEIDRLERGGCARCERRARLRALLHSAAIGVAIALVAVVGLCFALEWMCAGLPRFGRAS